MNKILELEKRIENLEKIVKSLQTNSTMPSKNKNNSKLTMLMTKHISKLRPQDLVILLLFSKPMMNKDEIKSQFKTLGTTNKMLNWFNGGNFKQRLLDTGIIYEDGKKEKKTCYSLTKGKGHQTVEKIIQNLESIS